MIHFPPWPALVGGALIGTAAVLLLWWNGRIAGVSGIAGGIWDGRRGERAWRWLFLVGLVLGGGLWAFAVEPGPAPRPGFAPALLVHSGLLVGYGTSMSGGCTSGHGVCGLARLSLRSLIATGVFLVVAMLIAFASRHLLHIG